MSFIDEKFLDPKYYYNSMSLYLKQSFGIKERMKIFIDFLYQLEATGDKMFDCLNIFDPQYESKKDTGWSESTEDYWLDIIGDTFGLSRQQTTNVDDETQRFTLTNDEYLLYIQIMIVKNVFDGTNESLLLLYNGSTNKYYNRIIDTGAGEAAYGDEVENWEKYLNSEQMKYKAQELKMVYFSNSTLTAQIVSTDNSLTAQTKPHLYYLFKNKDLAITSLGITYSEPAIVDNLKIGKLGRYFRIILTGDYQDTYEAEWLNDDGTFESAVVTDIGDNETITFEVMLLSGEIYTSAINGNYCVKLNGQHRTVGGKMILGVDLTYKVGGKFYEKKDLFDFSMLPDSNDFGTYSSMQCFTDYQVVTLLGNQEEVNQNEV